WIETGESRHSEDQRLRQWFHQGGSSIEQGEPVGRPLPRSRLAQPESAGGGHARRWRRRSAEQRTKWIASRPIAGGFADLAVFSGLGEYGTISICEATLRFYGRRQ